MGNFATGAHILFFFLAAAIVGFSLLMLFSRNFVHSAAYLAAALMCFAGVFALLNATFLALLTVFIYAGAITVVVVFVVMMTRVGVDTYAELLQPQTGWAGLMVAVFAIGLPVTAPGLMPALSAITPILGSSKAAPDTAALAQVLLEQYAAPFEISSLILLAALIGAIYLAKEGRP